MHLHKVRLNTRDMNWNNMEILYTVLRGMAWKRYWDVMEKCSVILAAKEIWLYKSRIND